MMPKRDKGRRGAANVGADQTKSETKHTTPDPLVGWFNLAKPSRARQQKRGWQKGAKR